MSPEGFLEFRDPLAPASGFQSRQFRAIEWISGVRDTWPGGGEPPPGPSLYEAFSAGPGCRRTRGAHRGARRALPRPRRRAAGRLARGRRAADGPRRGDRALAPPPRADGGARDRLAARAPAARRASPYLRRTVDRRFFPELWDVRVALSESRAAAPRAARRSAALARHGSPRSSSRPGTFASVQRRGCRSSSSSSSQASGVATGAPGSRAPRTGRPSSARTCCGPRRRRTRPPRFSLRQAVVSSSGRRSATRSAIVPARGARLVSVGARGAAARRRGSRASRTSSRTAPGPAPAAGRRARSAPARMAGKCDRSSSSGGSRSNTSRSGRSGASARAVQTCGVTQLNWASATITCAPPTAWVTVPPLPRRATATRRTQSGTPLGISCWTTTGLSIPAFQRQTLSGRSATCGRIAGSTAT